MLTIENYKKGFLINDEWMAGVSADEKGGYLAFVLDAQSGNLIGAHPVGELNTAIELVNGLKSNWKFESTGCGGGKCGSDKCKPNEIVNGVAAGCCGGGCGK